MNHHPLLILHSSTNQSSQARGSLPSGRDHCVFSGQNSRRRAPLLKINLELFDYRFCLGYRRGCAQEQQLGNLWVVLVELDSAAAGIPDFLNCAAVGPDETADLAVVNHHLVPVVPGGQRSSQQGRFASPRPLLRAAQQLQRKLFCSRNLASGALNHQAGWVTQALGLLKSQVRSALFLEPIDGLTTLADHVAYVLQGHFDRYVAVPSQLLVPDLRTGRILSSLLTPAATLQLLAGFLLHQVASRIPKGLNHQALGFLQTCLGAPDLQPTKKLLGRIQRQQAITAVLNGLQALAT
mmetsp:Transcript_77639/g.177787  ORF Transcript_77639/g.177787 Transcript_77639/m.177787 type:complete len:295 (+) Transcript_77639:786-1670(+)